MNTCRYACHGVHESLMAPNKFAQIAVTFRGCRPAAVLLVQTNPARFGPLGFFCVTCTCCAPAEAQHTRRVCLLQVPAKGLDLRRAKGWGWLVWGLGLQELGRGLDLQGWGRGWMVLGLGLQESGWDWGRYHLKTGVKGVLGWEAHGQGKQHVCEQGVSLTTPCQTCRLAGARCKRVRVLHVIGEQNCVPLPEASLAE